MAHELNHDLQQRMAKQYLARMLRDLQRATDWSAVESADDERCLDVRLQVVDGDSHLHSGDAQYDTDHRGCWGASSIGEHDDWDALVDTAGDLMSQAAEMAADDGDAS